jgi:cytochrome c oxidase cbb3-type subunit 3
MGQFERDPHTGYLTTGHEWNGITELNTGVPRSIWWFMGVTHLYALIAWVILPTWPLVTTYTKGIMNIDQQERVERQVEEANQIRAVWADRVRAEPVAAIRADERLNADVMRSAPALFGDNCAACHGREATGGPGFPSLVYGAWLLGGDPETILETLRVGITSDHPDTRVSQMLAFGRDGILTRPQVETVVGYVRSLSGAEATPEVLSEGAQIFAENCASCHGADGRGLDEMGSPDLTDGFWIYGGDHDSVFRTVWGGRQGWMPSWEGRLTDSERKILTAYLLDIRREEAR